MNGSSNVQIHRSSDLQLHRESDLQIHRSSDLPITDLEIQGSTYQASYRSTDVTLKIINKSINLHISPFLKKLFNFFFLKREKAGFPPPSPPCNVVPLFELPIENDNIPTLNGRNRGGMWILLFSDVTLFEYHWS